MGQPRLGNDEASGWRFLLSGAALLCAPWVLLGIYVLFVRPALPGGLPQLPDWILYTALLAWAAGFVAGFGLIVAAIVMFLSDSGRADRRL